jgi:ABC-type sugar transport system permease subunit
MFDPSLFFASIYIGAVFSTLIVGLCLRHLLENPKLRVLYRGIVIILGAFGVFFAIFSWSYMLFQDPNLEHFLPVFGLTVLYSLIFGLIVTSGLNKTEKKKSDGSGWIKSLFKDLF